MIVLDTGGAHLGVARCCATYTRVVQRFVTGSLRTRDPERTGLQSRPSHVTEAEPDSVCDPSDAPGGTFLSPRLRLNIARVLPTDADLPLTYASTCAGIRVCVLWAASSWKLASSTAGCAI